MNESEKGDRIFWALAAEFLQNPAVGEGKVMSSRCLRANGDFVAMVSHKTQQLIVKLNKQEVDMLIGEGIGEPFAPAGRVFKEWVEIKGFDTEQWRALISDAIDMRLQAD